MILLRLCNVIFSLDYDNIDYINLPPSKIWIPDIYLYNSANYQLESNIKTNVVVSNDGACLWVEPYIFKSTCKIDSSINNEQYIDLKFGSWTYNGLKVQF